MARLNNTLHRAAYTTHTLASHRMNDAETFPSHSLCLVHTAVTDKTALSRLDDDEDGETAYFSVR